MSGFKVYPTNNAGIPSEEYEHGGRRAHRDIYESHAAAIMAMSEVEFVLSALDEVDASVNGIEETIDNIRSILHASKNRMDQLHAFLGAFDVSESGKLTKPDSEKIPWEKLIKKQPALKLVD